MVVSTNGQAAIELSYPRHREIAQILERSEVFFEALLPDGLDVCKVTRDLGDDVSHLPRGGRLRSRQPQPFGEKNALGRVHGRALDTSPADVDAQNLHGQGLNHRCPHGEDRNLSRTWSVELDEEEPLPFTELHVRGDDVHRLGRAENQCARVRVAVRFLIR